ncbi:peptidyl-prolyl cis-trans isomerase [Pelistega indica]|uniref:Chaperone SurA n=1 Tax=Pelistega indica TaxID=1414851 RepID=V8G185_9BURK|nr:peptidylprolyl isomerase [Pelistega indica]ETD70195.1 peptidyl-prolyl cis-trans isomerase [Pelistega indica]
MQFNNTWLRIALMAIPGFFLSSPEVLAKKNHSTKQVHSNKQGQGNFVDGIAAIVDTDVITQRELNNRMTAMRVSGNQATPEQVLSLLIDEHLMNAHADQMNIKISNQQLEQGLQSIAKDNNLTVEQLKQAAKQHGINWDEYVANIKQQMKMEELRSQVVRARVNVTERDVDAFLIQHPTGLYADYKKPVAYEPRYEKRQVVERSFDAKAIAFQHIYIRVPDGSSAEVVEAARKKANEALSKIRGGQSFASVARQYSDAPEASQGGNLGIRMNEDWPALFMSVSKKVRDGSTTGVFKAPNGFHILKVLERRGVINETRRVVSVRLPDPPQPQLTPREQAAKQAGPVNVTESNVRHILVRITPVFSDAQAKARIDEIAAKLNAGEPFADVALKYSQDSSASLGGDIGWISPGQADPAFEQAVANLQPGQISAPVRSQFGWHIIEVLDRRTEDKQASIRRDLAHETLYQEQAENVLRDWVQQLRSQAYIDNRLTGEKTTR